MMLPKLEYCDFISNQLSSSRYSALEHLQIRAARIVLMKDDGHIRTNKPVGSEVSTNSLLYALGYICF